MVDQVHSFLRLDRLRIMAGGRAAYDQEFHQGVNIIRGDNSSGKSTIADFIFYVLGGDFKAWKPATAPVDEVQAQITTPRGQLTLRREKTEGRPPIWVFFGGFDKAREHGLDEWEKYPIQRGQSNLSFSEVLFRSMLLPEAQSDGASNITSHQLLRLLYSDQRTPAPRLFRYEDFDKATIRTAVGDLVCGIRSFGLFEVELKIRELEARFSIVDGKWKALLNSFPDQVSVTAEAVGNEIKNIEAMITAVRDEVNGVDEAIGEDENTKFFVARKKMVSQLRGLREKLKANNRAIELSELEINEIERFIDHLSTSLEMVKSAEKTADFLGEIEFSHCPSCLQEIKRTSDGEDCHLCGQHIDADLSASRYNQIRVDLELQIKESNQLLASEREHRINAQKAARVVQKKLEELTSEFVVSYELSNSPREAYLAERHSKLGRLNRELEQLKSSLQRAAQLDALSAEKDDINKQLTGAKEQRTVLEKQAANRRRAALNLASQKSVSILREDDSGAQEEFENAEHVDLRFEDDAILLDGLANFSESSNVFLKNAAILGLHLAACSDAQFFHPRFALFDNVEDKGMQPQRSHCFQELIVKMSTETPLPNQVIFTTSMMNPELELEEYTIGPEYSKVNKTLDFG